MPMLVLSTSANCNVLPTGTDQHRCSAQWAHRLTERTSSCRATTKPTATNKYSHSSKVQMLSVRQSRQTNAMYTTSLLTFIISVLVFQGCVYGEGKVVQPAGDGGFEPNSYLTNPGASHSTGKVMYTSQNACWMIQRVKITPWGWRLCPNTNTRAFFPSHQLPPVISQMYTVLPRSALFFDYTTISVNFHKSSLATWTKNASKEKLSENVPHYLHSGTLSPPPPPPPPHHGGSLLTLSLLLLLYYSFQAQPGS